MRFSKISQNISARFLFPSVIFHWISKHEIGLFFETKCGRRIFACGTKKRAKLSQRKPASTDSSPVRNLDGVSDVGATSFQPLGA